MKKLEKYTGDKTYMFPNSTVATPQIIEEKFPAISHFTHIIETDENGEVCFAIQNLSAMKSMYQIDPDTSDDEAISLIQEKINEQPVIEINVSPEERIAAALEFNNLLNM